MSDYSGEVMAEVLAERALVRPQIIPLVPLTNQYRHQDHMDLKDYKSKVRLTIKNRIVILGGRILEKFVPKNSDYTFNVIYTWNMTV